MKRALDPERRAAIAAHLRFYRDLGVYDFYRRAVPLDADEAGLAGDAAREAAGAFDRGSTAECEPMKTGAVLDKPAALMAVRQELGDCKRCPLHQLGRKQIVFGVGNA
jgi:DNA polymerase